MREVAIAIRDNPRRAEYHAAIGNGLIRETRYLEAIEAYRMAVLCDPYFAAARLALAELLAIGQNPQWREQLQSALAVQREYADPELREGRLRVTLLLRDAPYSVNTPLELIVDRSEIALDKAYVESLRAPHVIGDVLFCAFNYSRESVAAIDAAERIIAASALPFVNHPARLKLVAREHLSETLAGIDRVAVPVARVVAAEHIHVGGKTLVRPVDTHAGAGLALLETSGDLSSHIQRHPAAAYHVSQFVEYASADGLYRKYRIIFVNGVPYPYHLAISPRWMVHYRNAPMEQNAWMREEEAEFLRDPRRIFEPWDETLPRIGQAVGLEYFGIDCALLQDGSILIFEADPSMLVHDEDAVGIFSYKRSAIAKIRNALAGMLAARAQSTS